MAHPTLLARLPKDKSLALAIAEAIPPLLRGQRRRATIASTKLHHWPRDLPSLIDIPKQAVILAGGKGTRLQDAIGLHPKCLVDLGGIPILGHQLKLLARSGFKDVFILVNHFADQVADWVSRFDSQGVRVRLVRDGAVAGTAGALLSVLPRLAAEFAVIYGDTLIRADLQKFWAWHRQDSTAGGTLFVRATDHPHDSDLVELDDDGYVQRFKICPHREPPPGSNLANAALYIMRRMALEEWPAPTQPMDIAKDLFPLMLASGIKLRGYISNEAVIDAGTPERLAHVRAMFRSK